MQIKKKKKKKSNQISFFLYSKSFVVAVDVIGWETMNVKDPLIIAAGQLMLAHGPQPGRPVCFSLIQVWILSFSSGTEE